MIRFLYFLLGLLTDFTDSSEKVWLQRFSIIQIEWITAVIGVAWSPLRIIIASISDCLPYKKIQAVVVMSIGSLLWIVFSQTFDQDKWAILFLLVLTEVVSSAYHTILDGEKAAKYNTSETNLAAYCESARLFGSLIAALVGGNAQFYLGISIVAIIQGSAQFVTAILLTILWCRTRYYTVITDDEEASATKASEEETTAPTTCWGRVWGRVCEIWEVLQVQRKKPLVMFITVVSVLPSGSNSMYYYLYGPLSMDTAQLGTIESFGAFSEITAALLFGYLPLHRMRTVAYLTASSVSVYQVILLGVICRVFAPWDYWVLLYGGMMVRFTTGIMWTMYLSEATKSCSKNKEATEYSIIMSVPMIGRMIKYCIEIGLTNGFKVDHDHFDHMPEMFAVISSLSIIGIIASFITK